MMAYWHKKQAENKSLVENDEDQYLHSAWANPKAFKNQMNGLSGDIRLRWLVIVPQNHSALKNLATISLS